MKKRIVLASLLKTVDDPRMYYKFAKSLQTQDKYDINIVGFPSKSPVNDPAIHFYPLPAFGRKSLKRWTARIHAARTIWSLKPSLLIISTHELLGIALMCRFFQQARVIYDVRENYVSNLRHRGSFAAKTAGALIRIKEYISSPFIDHFTLAEECYREELPFARPYTVLENRALPPAKPLMEQITFQSPPVKFLFTGTLAEQTGVLEAIKMVTAYRKCVTDATLHIVGNSFDRDFMKKLRARLEENTWIDPEIDEQPIPYPIIIASIENADIGIIAYEELPFLIHKKPTKLFEYTGHHLPIMFSHKNTWYHDTDKIAGAILYNSNCQTLVKNLQQTAFYPTQVPKETYWNSLENTLLKLINKLL